MINTEKTLDKLVALSKGRGFVYAGSEIYGGLPPEHRRDQVHQYRHRGKDAAGGQNGGKGCQAGIPGHQPSGHLRRLPAGRCLCEAVRADPGGPGQHHPGADASQ